MNVTVESELGLVLQGSNGAGVPEASYLCVTLSRNWGKGGSSTSCHMRQHCAAWDASSVLLTSFEGHDAFQTGEFRRVQAHVSESGDHLLKGLNLRHDFRHALRLCVFSVHAYEEGQSKCHHAGRAHSGEGYGSLG